MEELSRYKNILLVLVIAVFIFIVGKNMLADLNSQKKRLVKGKAKIEEYKEMIKQWDIVSKKYKKTKSKLFEDPLVFRQFVENQSQSNRIRIESFRPWEEDMGFFLQGHIEISFEAAYADTVKFISSLQKKGIKIVRISMSRSSLGNVVVRLTLEGFIIKNGG